MDYNMALSMLKQIHKVAEEMSMAGLFKDGTKLLIKKYNDIADYAIKQEWITPEFVDKLEENSTAGEIGISAYFLYGAIESKNKEKFEYQA